MAKSNLGKDIVDSVKYAVKEANTRGSKASVGKRAAYAAKSVSTQLKGRGLVKKIDAGVPLSSSEQDRLGDLSESASHSNTVLKAANRKDACPACQSTKGFAANPKPAPGETGHHYIACRNCKYRIH